MAVPPSIIITEAQPAQCRGIGRKCKGTRHGASTGSIPQRLGSKGILADTSSLGHCSHAAKTPPENVRIKIYRSHHYLLFGWSSDMTVTSLSKFSLDLVQSWGIRVTPECLSVRKLGTFLAFSSLASQYLPRPDMHRPVPCQDQLAQLEVKQGQGKFAIQTFHEIHAIPCSFRAHKFTSE